MELTKFTSNLKKIRTSKGISAVELSTICNFRQKKRVADIEDNRGKPTLEEVYVICKELKVSIEDMLNKRVNILYTFE